MAPIFVNAESKFAQAVAAHKAGNLAEAESLYKETLRLDSRHVGALLNLGVMALHGRQFDAAINVFKAAVGVAPASAQAHQLLGVGYRSAGREAEAIPCFDKAKSLDPGIGSAAAPTPPAPAPRRPNMTVEDAIGELLRDPIQRPRLVDSYITRTPTQDAEAFAATDEFAEILRLLGKPVAGLTVVDLGAGRGIASHAFVKAGAAKVYAIEPDPSALVGYGAIGQLSTADRINIIDSFGESIPLPAAVADIVYVRSTLHHAVNLESLIAECFRLCKPGGIFFACREHIVDDQRQLAAFLAAHPVHQMAGGENAYPEHRYVSAIRDAGFTDVQVLKSWDSVINTFPTYRTTKALEEYIEQWARRERGFSATPSTPPAAAIAEARRQLNTRPDPGRLYTFVAKKSALLS